MAYLLNSVFRSNRTACCCLGARSRLTELLFVCLQNSEIQMWDLRTGWDHGQEMAVVRRASVLTSQQLLQSAPTHTDLSSYYDMHCVNLSKTRVWNICLSVCLSAWRSPISETVYICLGVPTSACTWRKIPSVGGNTEKRRRRRRKRRTAGKPCLSATWSTTDLFRNLTTTSQATYSFFIDMTNQ